MSDFELHPLAAAAAPGLGPRARAILDGGAALPTATPRLTDLDHVELRHGPAWSDPRWREELARDHRRWGADPTSDEALARLGAGAACVVTGQQPGLLLGPLYTAYKILGAIALARALELRHGRPVVPVYWCGSDDSDFGEVRRAWLWRTGEGPYRAELDAALWRTGQRVGSVRGESIAATEHRAIGMLAPGPGREALLRVVDDMQSLDTLGDRAAAWALRLFPGSGLIVVDARSSRLRAHGAELMMHYAREHRSFTELLRGHADALRRQGWATPLDERALASGLFVLDGDVRRKLGPDELGTAKGERAPSVLLRPLWQDAALAPVAAVLGPSELQYHAQIVPLYRELRVHAARPAPRPHLTLWPRAAPWVEPVGEHEAWLAGGVDLKRALIEAAIPAQWESAWSDAAGGAERALAELGSRLGDGAALEEVRATSADVERRLRALRDRLGRRALQRSGTDLGLAALWLQVRGAPQERSFAAPCMSWWCGESTPHVMDTIATQYVAAIDAGRSPTWALRGGTMW